MTDGNSGLTALVRLAFYVDSQGTKARLAGSVLLRCNIPQELWAGRVSHRILLMTSRRSRARLAKPNRPATQPALSWSKVQAHPYALGAAAGVVGLAVSAFINHQLARKAERDSPPAGKL